ncbi:hypothetical protein V6N13_115704 [Hibiscus sabdariffa]|uniref:S-acyltransferase n=1 Tax=Hibiscus sabdariffa TaxID=183260 RepID=A0ABR2CSI9_9ROSI
MAESAESAESSKDYFVTTVDEDHDITCWGCGLRLLLPSYAPVFKCGWCRAITNQNVGVYGRSFRCAGTPPTVVWGSYPAVGKGDLENYTFCHYCSKPKSPRAHHCRSCGSCVLDMDHHCPFIGNCVGAANHRHFIAFLFAAVFSTSYVSIMSTYAGLHIWTPVKYRSLWHLNSFSSNIAIQAFEEVMLAFASSAVQLSARGLVLVYLFISSVSLQIGLGVLLWQQLGYIYEGKTYLGHLSSQGSGDDRIEEKDCQNILRFFGCPYSVSRYFPSLRNSPKRHTK